MAGGDCAESWVRDFRWEVFDSRIAREGGQASPGFREIEGICMSHEG